MIWKDRIKQYPHRYTLTNVSGSTYDFTEVTGEVTEAGTPVNAENLNKLIQRDGDDIKDTVTTFAEASTRENIATGEKTSTIFGKIKKWFTDLKPHAFNNLATVQGAETDKAPTNKLFTDTVNSIVPVSSIGTVGGLEDNGDYVFLESAFGQNWSSATYNLVIYAKNSINFDMRTIYLEITHSSTDADSTVKCTAIGTNLSLLSDIKITYSAAGTAQMKVYFARSGSYKMFGAKLISAEKRRANTTYSFINESVKTTVTNLGHLDTVANLLVGSTFDKTNISTVMPISSAAASNDKVLGEKVVYDEFATKSYADSVPAYDKIIRTQLEFEALIASPNWLDAESVALVGQFTYSEANNSGIKVPDTVKQIHGFNSAKITITNFKHNSVTAKGGLWYDTLPTTPNYSIRDLEVDCTGTGATNGYGFSNCINLTNCTGTGTGTGTGAPGYGFYSCINLTNCTGTGTGAPGYGFSICTNLTNCTGTGTGTGATNGYGFSICTNLTNCTGTGTGTGASGYGFSICTNLTNCTGTGTGTGASGYGFSDIKTASNCRDGGSSTDMWGGTNQNIDLDTCCKTLVEANNTELNT